MLIKSFSGLVALTLLAIPSGAQPERKPPVKPSRPVRAERGFHGLQVQKLDGKTESLARYRGWVCLLVNVPLDAEGVDHAARTAELRHLRERYKRRGFCVLAFPESVSDTPREPDRTSVEAWKRRHRVKFPTFAPLHVRGPHIHPLYRFLTENGPVPARVEGPYRRYLVDRHGRVIARFAPGEAAVTRALETALQTVVRPAAGTDPASRALVSALRKARTEKKTVLLTFLARADVASKRLTSFLEAHDVVPIIAPNYVRLDFRVPDLRGADRWLAVCAEGRRVRLPWTVWLSASGRVVESAFDGRGSIGFPSSPGEIARFVAAFGRTARHVTPDQLDRLRAALVRAGRRP